MTDIEFRPASGFDLPRFAGIATFMRLAHVPLDDPRLDQVQIGLIGVPWDAGTTNRPGPRHGPRQMRDASSMIRAQHGVSGMRPFQAARCADLGDIGPNPADMADSMARITAAIATVLAAGIVPVVVGGDHLCSLPVLRAVAAGDPVGLIHFDSHTDLFHSYFGGSLYTHGTPFRRALEEGLIDPARTVQIGIRGTAYDSEDRDFARAAGIRVIAIEEFFDRGIPDVMDEARRIAGRGRTYLSYDIDFVDPAYAPGTGTPEIGGPTSYQALQVLRELNGVNIVAADLVELSPPFDAAGGTAYLGASLLFEMLCQIAGRLAADRAD